MPATMGRFSAVFCPALSAASIADAAAVAPAAAVIRQCNYHPAPGDYLCRLHRAFAHRVALHPEYAARPAATGE